MAIYSILNIAIKKKKIIENFLSKQGNVFIILLIFFAVFITLLLIGVIICISKFHREHLSKDGFPIFNLKE